MIFLVNKTLKHLKQIGCNIKQSKQLTQHTSSQLNLLQNNYQSADDSEDKGQKIYSRRNSRGYKMRRRNRESPSRESLGEGAGDFVADRRNDTVGNVCKRCASQLLIAAVIKDRFAEIRALPRKRQEGGLSLHVNRANA